MKQAVIFDLDGTLADTLSSIAFFANRALTQCGYQEIPVEEYRYLVGNGAKRLVHGMLSYAGDDTPEAFDKVSPLYNDGYDADSLYLTKPYDGILPLLKSLHERGVKIGVLSNKPDRTTQKIANALFGDFIDSCRGQRDETPRKPDPAGVFLLLRELSVSPEECLYVGDTKTDMQTGKAAGIFTVGVTWGFRDRTELEEHHADAIISSPNELLAYL